MLSRRRTFVRHVGALVGVLVTYLLLWPVPIDPVAWQPAPHPPLEGALAVNSRLTDAQRLGPSLHGPEDVAIAADGRIFSGTHDGTIVVYSPDGSVAQPWVDTGGRPLGLAWDASKNLIVADAQIGLLSIAPDKAVTVLATESEGIPPTKPPKPCSTGCTSPMGLPSHRTTASCSCAKRAGFACAAIG